MMAARPVRAAAQAAQGVVRHASWWLCYRLNGQTHPAPERESRRPSERRRDD
jgi:hypothetical protein